MKDFMKEGWNRQAEWLVNEITDLRSIRKQLKIKLREQLLIYLKDEL